MRLKLSTWRLAIMSAPPLLMVMALVQLVVMMGCHVLLELELELEQELELELELVLELELELVLELELALSLQPHCGLIRWLPLESCLQDVVRRGTW